MDASIPRRAVRRSEVSAPAVAPLSWPTPAPAEGAAPAGHRGRPARRILALVLGVLVVGGALTAGAWRLGMIAVPGLGPWTSASSPEGLTLFGNIDVRQVNLSFKVGGRIASLPVDEGHAVTAGQVLATLETSYFDDEVRLAQAQRDAKAAVLERLERGSRPEEIAQAEAFLAERLAASARADVDARRTRQLLAQQAVSVEEYEQIWASAKMAQAQADGARESLQLARIGPREEDIAAARADRNAAEVQLQQAQRRLEDATLTAPGPGIILTRAREVGAIVQPGEVVFALTLTAPVWVRTYINEPDLGKIRPGDAVEVVTDSRPDQPYRGHVGYISPTAEFTPKSVETEELRTRLVYRLRVVVDDPDGFLRQGMPVTVRVPQS